LYQPISNILNNVNPSIHAYPPVIQPSLPASLREVRVAKVVRVGRGHRRRQPLHPHPHPGPHPGNVI